MRMSKFILSTVLALGVSVISLAAHAAEPENTLIIDLDGGEVKIALRPDLAPKHVERMKELARRGDYDNVAFHRVIEGFMAQTGDVEYGKVGDDYDSRRVGSGGSDLGYLPAEFSEEPFIRGVIGMARSQNPDSANSQFFIMFAPAPHLKGEYTIVGQVEEGMELVDKIKKGSAFANGSVSDPDKMNRVRVASDQ